MGLSSSQGRLLMLTSRLSDIELGEVLTSQKQQQLAIDKENVAKEYQDAMNNYTIQVKVPDLTGQSKLGYNLENISHFNLQQAGYLVHNSNNEIILFRNEDGTYGSDYTTDDGKTVKGVTDAYGKLLGTVNKKQDREDEYYIEINGQTYDLIDANEYGLADSNVLNNFIVNGQLYLYNVNSGQPNISTAMLPSETSVQYVLDTSDDAEAESKYEYELAKISRQDNMLDIEMQQLETQHEAVLKEYESVKKVISNNIDRTFKLFSDG